MINSVNEQAGLSLIEVLVAILVLSVTILGLMSLQSVLLADLDRANKQLHAEHIAFQLLDIYPDLLSVNLPNGWQHQIITTQHSVYCQEVKVVIQPDLGNIITQERWFCQR